MSIFQAIVDAVVNLQFSLIEALWQGFWRNQTPETTAEVRNLSIVIILLWILS